MSQPAAQGLPAFLKVWEEAEGLSTEESPSGTTTWWLTSKSDEALAIRVNVAREAYKIILENPEFYHIWQGIIIKMYNKDSEQLEYINNLRTER